MVPTTVSPHDAGPWPASALPACNTSQQCNAWLQQAGGFAFGATCYPNLASSAPRDGSAGNCACSNGYGWGGPLCASATPSTPGNTALYAVALAALAVVGVRFAPVTLAVLRARAWRANAAGTTFLFAWASLLMFQGVTATTLVLAAQPGMSTAAQAGSVRNALNQAGIVFLTCSVLNMSAAFVEMSATTRVIENVNKFRGPLVVFITVVVLLILLLFFLADAFAPTIVGIIVVGGLGVAGVAGPTILYLRSAKNMSMLQTPPSRSTLLRAMFWDAVFNTNAMLEVLGLTSTSQDNGGSLSSSKESKDAGGGGGGGAGSTSRNNSKTSREGEGVEASPATPTSGGGGATGVMSLPRPMSLPRLTNKGSKQSVMGATTASSQAHAHAREAKMVSFLGKTLKMGLWVCLSLYGYLLTVGSDLVLARLYDASETVKMPAVFVMIEYLFLSVALYSMLWYICAVSYARVRVVSTLFGRKWASSPKAQTMHVKSKEGGGSRDSKGSKVGSYVAGAGAGATGVSGGVVVAAPSPSPSQTPAGSQV